jgi:hypothetical protein
VLSKIDNFRRVPTRDAECARFLCAILRHAAWPAFAPFLRHAQNVSKSLIVVFNDLAWRNRGAKQEKSDHFWPLRFRNPLFYNGF